MKRIKAFFKTSLIGGMVVILPVAILLFVFKWIFNIVTDIIQPLTNLVMMKSQTQEILADMLVIAVILTACFIVGVFVRTRLGTFIYKILENRILKIAPGYSLVKETVIQFLGNKKSPFSSVALVQIFGNETLVSAFVTDTHANGSYSVFVPTGPNPTSGNIYHLKGKYVHPVDIPVEDAMRSIISCGAGSTRLINAYMEKSGNDINSKGL
ncbi:MAG: DUF502 domain-containing protein [Nitrospinota bacterium]